jgi:transcriptional regulator with XRE-family HTH domain
MGKNASFGFGKRLRDRRLELGMSGVELGLGAGGDGKKDASKQSVSDWENERHYPKADQIRVICLKLRLSADYLIFGDLSKNKEAMNAAGVVHSLSNADKQAVLALMMGEPSAKPTTPTATEEEEAQK